ncbi:MAG: haloperoxidase, partial [Sediminibacterium sp.]
FTDNTEVEFGLPIRKFTSFSAAAKEASISRLYGGIHFRDAIDQGIWLGDQVGLLAGQRLASHINSMR